jgi:hypothetical protein
MVSILGEGVIPEAAAFHDVRDALDFDRDIILCAHVAPLLGITLKDVAIYNLEPLYDGCRSFSVGYLETLKRCHVLDYSRRNVEYLKDHGIEAFHMPYGYHASLERAKPAEQDIDVLFVGSVNPRRTALFVNLARDLNFVWAGGVYGVDLDRLIARAKVHLNVHFCDPHPLEVVRLNYLMANHCTIVSERGEDDQVNRDYQDGLIFARADELSDACRHALSHPVDGSECIRAMPHDCKPAQHWLNERQG